MRTCHIDETVLAKAERVEDEPLYDVPTLRDLSPDPEIRQRWHRRTAQDEVSDGAGEALRQMLA